MYCDNLPYSIIICKVMMFFLTICCSKADHFLLKCPFNKNSRSSKRAT